MTLLLAVVAGAMVGLGLLVAAVAIAGPPERHESRRRVELPAWLSDRFALRVSLAAVAAVVVWAVTGWPAGGLVAGVGAAAGPGLV
ncbi:MAG: type II secretion system F family protein, partial [Acidimicrobiia bacterium]